MAPVPPRGKSAVAGSARAGGVMVAMSWTPELLALLVLALLAAVFAGVVAWLALRLAGSRREVAVLARAHEIESAARLRAASRAAWLDAALEAGPDGVLVADGGLRVVHWNRRFAALSGLSDDMPREGASLAALLRLSAEAGEFGLVDVDQEVARQVALIMQGPDAFPVLRHRPDGSIVEFVLEAVPGGGLLLHCADVTTRHRPMAASLPTTARPAAPPVPSASAPSLSSGPRPRRCQVLLVEDMKVNQMITATQLRRDGHRVDVAESGAVALRLAATTPYDMVLMDLMMPGMSGYEAARQLRGLSGPAGTTPIYALTANTGDEERARCLAAGMQGMLSKPVPAALLRDVLRAGPPASPAASPIAPVSSAPVSSASALAGDGLLSPTRLAELRRDLPTTTLAALCGQCLDDMHARIAALQAALARTAPDAVEREAHALAGMAGSYGLARIERLARAILTPARAGDVAAARDAARGMDDAFTLSRAALLAWVAPGG